MIYCMFVLILQDFREDPESKAVAEVHQKLFEVRRLLVQCSYASYNKLIIIND